MYITFDEIMSYKMKVEGLQAENKRLNDKDGLYDEVKELQAENKKLHDANKTRLNEIIELEEHNKRLMEQVRTNRDSNSNTHTHTISKEIAEYMDNNDKCNGARLFLLPRESFDNDGWLHDNHQQLDWDDGIE